MTMTQLAASFCSLINGGNYYEPHVVRQIQDENGNVTEKQVSGTFEENGFRRDLRDHQGLYVRSCEEGTGVSAAVEGYDIGGKTGTAESCPAATGNTWCPSSDTRRRRIRKSWYMWWWMNPMYLPRLPAVMPQNWLPLSWKTFSRILALPNPGRCGDGRDGDLTGTGEETDLYRNGRDRHSPQLRE